MKKMISLAVLLAVAVTSFSQQTEPSPVLTKQDYLQKSKSQRTSAFILLGTGAALLAVAAPGNVSFDILPILVIGGGAAIVGSIPLFIAAGKNKRKAMSLSFKNETVPLPKYGGFTYQCATSLTPKPRL